MIDKLTIETKEGKREFEIQEIKNTEWNEKDFLILDKYYKVIKEIKDQPKEIICFDEIPENELIKKGLKYLKFPIVFENNNKQIVVGNEHSIFIFDKCNIEENVGIYHNEIDLLRQAIKAIDKYKEMKTNEKEKGSM